MISAFTWSHDIDDITNSGLSVGNNGRASYPYQQLTLQRGNSDWNVAKRSVTGFHLRPPLRPRQDLRQPSELGEDALARRLADRRDCYLRERPVVHGKPELRQRA